MVCPNCHKTCCESDAFCPHCGYKLEESDVLYHYTSIETLNAILSNVKREAPEEANEDSLDFYKFVLRATHWAYLNDPSENNFLFEKLNESLNKNSEADCSIFDTVIGIIRSVSGQPYIISLSKSRDDLDMWRSYSKNGTGVAIGFKSNVIENIVKQIENYQSVVRSEFLDCRYLDDNMLDDEIKEYTPFIVNHLKIKPIPISWDLIKFILSFIRYKHPCYINEREKRIAVFSKPLDNVVKFRTANGINIPYIEVVLPLSSISEIIIGPCANNELNEDSIRMQLNDVTRLSNKIKIECSELPYRQI